MDLEIKYKVNKPFFLLFVNLVFRCFHPFGILANNSKRSRLLSSKEGASFPHIDQIAFPSGLNANWIIFSQLSQPLFVDPVYLECHCLVVTLDSVNFLYFTL